MPAKSSRSQYPHPRPHFYRWQQLGGAALLGLMLLTVPLQALLAAITGGHLFFITALLTLLLTAPVVMLLSATPPLTVRDEGLLLQPFLWRDRLVLWEDVVKLTEYPLLPRPDQEVERKALQGKRRYQAAEGIMLVVHRLPWQYRVAGFFAGERGQPVIAITNRTHQNYAQLKRLLEKRCPPADQG